MKLVCISDTHGYHTTANLPEGDVLVYAGDMGNHGTLGEVLDFGRWIVKQPHQYKVVIAGNHDRYFESNPALAQQILVENGCIYLDNNAVEIANIMFWGAPQTPMFYNWAFNVPRGQLHKYWDRIPDATDVLITHGPPHGILDKTEDQESTVFDPRTMKERPVVWPGEHCGCKELLVALARVKPQVHIFGHIHDGYGTLKKDNITFVNASHMDSSFTPSNDPIVVEVHSHEQREE